jgi:hypothetical protein
MSLRVRRILVISLLLGSFSGCASLSATCTAPSAVVGQRIFSNTPSLGLLDIRLASVEKVGSAFRFTIVLYSPLPAYAPCRYGFILGMPGSNRVLVLTASMDNADTPRWHLDKSDSGGGAEQSATICADCVSASEDTLTFVIPEAEIGSASTFWWTVFTNWPGKADAGRVLPDTGVVVWPLQGSGSASCPCGLVAVFSDKLEYKLGEVAIISVYLTMDATVAVTDTSGGVMTPIWTGWVKAGLHDLAALMFPKGGRITIVRPTGPEEIAITVTTADGCTRTHVTRFTVRE